MMLPVLLAINYLTLQKGLSNAVEVFEEGRIYKYKYDSVLQILGTRGKQDVLSAAASLQCTLVVEGLGSGQFQLKIRNVVSRRLVDEASDVYKNVEMEELPSLRRDIIFRLVQGKLTNLLVHEDETEFSLNIKRAIISHFEVTNKDFHSLDPSKRRCVFRKLSAESSLLSVACSSNVTLWNDVSKFAHHIVTNSKLWLISSEKIFPFRTSPETWFLKHAGIHFIPIQNIVPSGNPASALVESLQKLVKINLRREDASNPETIHLFGTLLEILETDAGIQPLFDIGSLWKSLSHGMNISEVKVLTELYLREALLQCTTTQCNKALQYLISNEFFDRGHLDQVLDRWQCQQDIASLKKVIDICRVQTTGTCARLMKIGIMHLTKGKKDVKHSKKTSLICNDLVEAAKDATVIPEGKLFSLVVILRACLSEIDPGDFKEIMSIVLKETYGECITWLVKENFQNLQTSERKHGKIEMLEAILNSTISALGNEVNNSYVEDRHRCFRSFHVPDYSDEDACNNSLDVLKHFIDLDKDPWSGFKEKMQSYFSDFTSVLNMTESCGNINGDTPSCFTIDEGSLLKLLEPVIKFFSHFSAENDTSYFAAMLQSEFSKILRWMKTTFERVLFEKFKKGSSPSSSFYFHPFHSKSEATVTSIGFPLNLHSIHILQVSFDNVTSSMLGSEFKYTLKPNIFMAARTTLATFLPGVLNITLNHMRYIHMNKNVTVLVRNRRDARTFSLAVPEREQLMHLKTLSWFKSEVMYPDFSVPDKWIVHRCTPVWLNSVAGVEICLASHRGRDHSLQEDHWLIINKSDKNLDFFTVVLKGYTPSPKYTDDSASVMLQNGSDSTKERGFTLLLEFEGNSIKRMEMIPSGYPENSVLYHMASNFTYGSNGVHIMRKNMTVTLKVFGSQLHGWHISYHFQGKDKDPTKQWINHDVGIRGTYQTSHALAINASYNSSDRVLHAECLLTHPGSSKQLAKYQVTFGKRESCPTLHLSHNVTSDAVLFSSNITEECRPGNSSLMYINITSASPSWKALNLDLHQVFLFGNPGKESCNVSSPFMMINVTGTWDTNQKISFNKTAVLVIHDERWPDIKLSFQRGLCGTRIMVNTSDKPQTDPRNGPISESNNNAGSHKHPDFVNTVFMASVDSGIEGHGPTCVCYEREFVSKAILARLPWIEQIISSVCI